MDKRLKKMTAIFFLAAAADLFLAAVLLASLARQRAEGATAPGTGRVVEDGGWSGGWDGPGTEEVGAVALTFDDGPNARYTEALLDGLKEREVRASFFLVGQCIEGNEDTVRRMAEEGHLIGVHCMEHRDLTREPEEEAVRQLMDTAAMIGAVTGRTPEYIRPPFGKWSSGLQEAVPMETVLWSVDSLDWKLQDTDRIVRRVLKDTEDGDIILMHDEFQTSVEAAMEIIDNLLAKGYTFVTVDELTID
ncbi:polysaccharide deacetylase family protein [Clostridium sp. MCC334]|mgnify:FL=1|jgi:peptidoglycan/xylan/chitin deacetylase (PgdA/CDA1 family)|nr:polysaccharide deacetylase family protein [Clostridium sp. MCC334]